MIVCFTHHPVSRICFCREATFNPYTNVCVTNHCFIFLWELPPRLTQALFLLRRRSPLAWNVQWNAWTSNMTWRPAVLKQVEAIRSSRKSMPYRTHLDWFLLACLPYPSIFVTFHIFDVVALLNDAAAMSMPNLDKASLISTKSSPLHLRKQCVKSLSKIFRKLKHKHGQFFCACPSCWLQAVDGMKLKNELETLMVGECQCSWPRKWKASI